MAGSGGVEDFMARLRVHKLANGLPLALATRNCYLALLRAALYHAVEDNYWHNNPARRFPQLPEHNARDRICSRDEYERLIDAAEPQLRLAIIIAYHTGMRLGEIAGLTWDHVDAKQRILKLKSSETKTSAARIVPIADAVRKELDAQPRRLDGKLFAATAGNLSAWFGKLCRELKIKDLRFHDLRHTAGTNLRRAGADIFTIKQITGHKTLAMLERYNTIDVEDLHDAKKKMAKRKR